MVARPLLAALTLALALQGATGQAQGLQQQPQVRCSGAGGRGAVRTAAGAGAIIPLGTQLPLPAFPSGLHPHFRRPLCG